MKEECRMKKAERPMSRSRQKAKDRYRMFLRMTKVCPDLTFHQFLTAPEFEERRNWG